MKSKRKTDRKLKENSSRKNQSASAPTPRDDDNSNDDAMGQSSHTIPPFSLILDRTLPLSESIDPPRPKCLKVQDGMVHLKNMISIDDQVEIVNKCQEFVGGFYQAGGKKLRMMCFGRNWDPNKKYDGSEAPPIPNQLLAFAETALQKAQEKDPEIPSMQPDICIVNFYETNDRLGLHQDRDESSVSLDKGLPVVSISIGDSAQFLYCSHKDKDARKPKEVLLSSGDVLIFGGESRHIYHEVTEIHANSAPHSLLEKSMLRPGRLNLTFRQY